MAVKVHVWEDHMGNIHGSPVRSDLRRKIESHLKDMTGMAEFRFFFQEGGEAEQFKEEFLSARQRKDIEHGYACYINIDPWILGHMYGYDTHTLFEGGKHA